MKHPCKYVYILTGTQFAFEAQAVEVVTLAVFAPHLTKLVCVAGTLSTQTVTPSTAGWSLWLLDTVGIIGRIIVLHRTLTLLAQTTGITLTHATLIGSVAIATQRAVGLRLCLAAASTGKIQCDLQRILKTQRFDGKCTAPLFGAATQLGLHAE